MKLSVLLITGSSDRVALDTVQNLAGQSGELAAEIFLIIAGDFQEENRKKLYLERAAVFGMTAFINIGGKSEAELLNTFIKYANADFCTVMRAGGKTDPSYFGRLTAPLEKDETLNIACGRRVKSGIDLFTPNDIPAGVVDLTKQYGCFPATFEGTIVRTSFAAEHRFDSEAGKFAEQKWMLSVLSECGKFYYDSRLSVWQENSGTDPAEAEELPEEACDAAYFTEICEKCLLPLADNCKGKDGRLPLFMQHYYTHKVYEITELGFLAKDFPEEERAAVIDTLNRTLKSVEDKVICDVYGVLDKNGYFTEDKLLLLGIKHGHENFSPDISYSSNMLYAVQKDIVLSDSTKLPVTIDMLNVYKGSLEIDGSFDSVFSERRTKMCAEYGGSEYRLTYDRKGEPRLFFGKRLDNKRTFHLTIPVSEERAELRFFILFKGCKYELKTLFGGLNSKLVNNAYESIFPLGNGYFATAENGRIETLCLDEKEQRRRFREAMDCAAKGSVPFMLRNSYRFTKFWFGSKNIWLFADDTEKGGGAAEDMFRYAMTRHDELYCYYLTDKNSQAAQKLIADGYKPLYTGSLLHRLLFLNAQVYITTQPNVLMKNMPGEAGISYSMSRHCRMHTVFLQDSPADKPSVAKNSRMRDNVRLYFCGTGEYFEELKKPEYGYENTEVLKLTGLTRFDDIIDRSGEDKLILMIARYVSKEEIPFGETEFFKNIKALLENEKLKKALDDSAYTLTLAFEGVTNDEAKALPKSEKVDILTDVFSADQLKSKASLIVTDNAEEIDAGFMRKPLIYYNTEGGRGYGERAETPDELAEMISGYIDGGMAVKEELSKKADEYFGAAPLGCKREIYNTIITYLYENGEIEGYEDFETADNYDENEE